MFDQAKIETALAIPVFSNRSKRPAFVFCCYSFVRSGSIPFVLKFVQQALKLLWGGLENVEPHESVDENIWKQVAPADLGEMAADVEMHQHFMIKKRPIGSISTERDSSDETMKSLTVQVNSLENISCAPSAPSIYIGQGPLENSSPQQVQRQIYDGIQSQIHDAIKSAAEMKPAHYHIATNSNGSKRAHIFLQEPHNIYTQQNLSQQQQNLPQQQQNLSQQQQNVSQQQQNVHGILSSGATSLPLPQPIPLPNQVLYHLNNAQETQTNYQSLQQQVQPQVIQNQISGYNMNTTNSHSFPMMQQRQLQENTQAPVPNSIRSAPVHNMNISNTNETDPQTPFMTQNYNGASEKSHITSIKNATPRVSSNRTKTNGSNKKVRIFIVLIDAP